MKLTPVQLEAARSRLKMLRTEGNDDISDGERLGGDYKSCIREGQATLAACDVLVAALDAYQRVEALLERWNGLLAPPGSTTDLLAAELRRALYGEDSCKRCLGSGNAIEYHDWGKGTGTGNVGTCPDCHGTGRVPPAALGEPR